MKLLGFASAALLSLTLIAAAPVFAQEQHEDEAKAKPAQQEDKSQPAKPGTQEDKTSKPAENNAKQQEDKNATKPADKTAQQRAGNNGGGRIPADKFKANFGQDLDGDVIAGMNVLAQEQAAVGAMAQLLEEAIFTINGGI